MPVLRGGKIVKDEPRIVRAGRTADEAEGGDVSPRRGGFVRTPSRGVLPQRLTRRRTDEEEEEAIEERETEKPKGPPRGGEGEAYRPRREVPPPTDLKPEPKKRITLPRIKGSVLERFLTRLRQPKGQTLIGQDENGFCLRLVNQPHLFSPLKQAGYEISGDPGDFVVWGPAEGVPFTSKEEALVITGK